MKKKIFITSLVALFAVSSCQKLDKEVTSELTENQIITQYGRMASLLNAVYGELQEGQTKFGGAGMASATDEAEANRETNQVQQYNTGNWSAASNPDNVWGPHFRGIRRANFYLKQDRSLVDMSSFRVTDAGLKRAVYELARSEYEARFLRAFFYFELVKRYGGVPIIKETLDESAVATVKRNSVEECFKFIVDECNAVINADLPSPTTTGTEKLPLRNIFDVTTADLGRVTRGAAMALKSKALLYAASDLFNKPEVWAPGYANKALISYTDVSPAKRTERWQAAADASLELINAYTGVALSPQYRELFQAVGPRQAENIFFRRAGNSSTHEANNFPVGFSGGGGATNPSQNLVDAYEVRTATGSVPFDSTDATHVANIYRTYAAAAPNAAGWVTPAANSISTAANFRDPRLNYTIAVNNSILATQNNFNRNIELYTGGRDATPVPFASKTGYYVRKYINGPPNAATAHTWVYFRLAEAYLNYAEAINQLADNGTNQATARTYINLVRSRASVSMPAIPTGLNQAQTFSRIVQERRVEFAFEDHRYWDARRWLMGPQILGVPIRGVTITSSNNTPGGTLTFTRFKVDDRVFDPARMYLYPIPQSELAVTKGVIVQNPGW